MELNKNIYKFIVDNVDKFWKNKYIWNLKTVDNVDKNVDNLLMAFLIKVKLKYN